MADLKIALRHMLRMLSAGQSAGLPDDELLMRFLEQRDEAAFESLLCRHGPMVLNTCRRLLGHLPDAGFCAGHCKGDQTRRKKPKEFA